MDPLALLVERCREVLPLPPFEVWVEDYLRDRRPYLEEMERGVVGPGRGSPVTIDLRRIAREDQTWVGGPYLFRESPDWRWFITFNPESDQTEEPPPALRRTADVFRESRGDDVRDRFRSFSEDTLQAFLRSALP